MLCWPSGCGLTFRAVPGSLLVFPGLITDDPNVLLGNRLTISAPPVACLHRESWESLHRVMKRFSTLFIQRWTASVTTALLNVYHKNTVGQTIEKLVYIHPDVDQIYIYRQMYHTTTTILQIKWHWNWKYTLKIINLYLLSVKNVPNKISQFNLIKCWQHGGHWREEITCDGVIDNCFCLLFSYKRYQLVWSCCRHTEAGAVN